VVFAALWKQGVQQMNMRNTNAELTQDKQHQGGVVFAALWKLRVQRTNMRNYEKQKCRADAR